MSSSTLVQSGSGGSVEVDFSELFPSNIAECESWLASSVPVGIETTVFTKLLADDFGILKVNYSGRADAVFRLKVDGTTIDYGQIIWTHRADEHLFPNGALVASSSTITITVFSYGELSADFFGSIHGRTITP